MSTSLPVAAGAEVGRGAVRLIRADGAAFTGMIGLNAVAAIVGLAGPWLLGVIVDAVTHAHGRDVVPEIDRLAFAIVVCALAQFLLSRWANLIAYRFGERTSARIREQFVDRALALPTAVVDRVGTGDLAARGTTDVSAVAATLRDGAPVVVIAALQCLFIVIAVLLIDPLLGACGFVGLSAAWAAARWYLRRARSAYLAEGAANSTVAEVLASTAAGARTVDALRLQRRRIDAGAAAIATLRATRTRTLFLRSVLFPSIDVSYVLPVVGVLLVGGALVDHGVATVGAVVASALYFRQLYGPLDAILMWAEQLQSSSASYARIEGLALASEEPDRSDAVPDSERIDVSGVRYAYGDGPDVLAGVDLAIEPGERIAIVGPSGAGKSTLGRLLAGVDRPRTGGVTVGGVPIASLPPERLRRQVVLVTQEHHVFGDPVRDNLLVAAPHATDDELRAALRSVGADWLDQLPSGLDTVLGPNGHRLDGAQAQQLALARVVLADPHTLILDEATALLDPATARNTERALAAVLAGRTVIAIAHRLQTAHDADRVAVMDGGTITELGTHDELIAAGGRYAALWASWQA
jgi:ATP-binding cassette subfamily C protein